MMASVLSVTTFCTFSREFSLYRFDSWAVVVIIESWLLRLKEMVSSGMTRSRAF